MPATLDARLDDIKAQAETILNTAKEEDRPLTSDEQQKFDDLIADGKKINEATANHQTAADAIGELAQRPDSAPLADRRSPGEKFVESNAFSDLQAQYPNGIPNGTKVQTGSVNVGSFRNALLTDPGLSEPLHVIDVPAGVQVVDLLNAITVIDDAPDTVKIFTASFTNAADVTAEGALKPESTLIWTPATLNQDTIAHHMPVTNQTLSHNPMMRGFVDRFMIAGVRARAQAQVGTDLAAWSGLTAQAFDTDLTTTLRRAMTKAQVNGAILGTGPISIVLSADDAETLDLEQISRVQLAPGQAPQQVQGIWRAPIVVAPSMVSGFAYVGDISQVIWFTAGGINVAVGLVNQQFIENEQTILAENEGVTGVIAAGAIVKADLTL